MRGDTKRIKGLLLVSLCLINLYSQKTWVVPANINPNDTLTIYVDIKQCNCQRTMNADSLYFWSWLPRDRDTGEATYNGLWTKSNEKLRMTSAGNNVWYYKMVPVDFYGVSATTLYEKDIYFYVKKKDGTGIGGTGCDRNATEELSVILEPPVTGLSKVKCFPVKAAGDTLSISQNDVFTVIYNNNLEEKTTLQGVNDFYVFLQATGSNNLTYNYGNLGNLGATPELAMTSNGKGLWSFSTIPSELFKAKLPTGVKVQLLKIQFARKTATGTKDIVDKTYLFYFNNTCD